MEEASPFEALNATPLVHPLTSACCFGIVTNVVVAATPNNPSATMAITTIDLVVVFSLF